MSTRPLSFPIVLESPDGRCFRRIHADGRFEKKTLGLPWEPHDPPSVEVRTPKPGATPVGCFIAFEGTLWRVAAKRLEWNEARGQDLTHVDLIDEEGHTTQATLDELAGCPRFMETLATAISDYVATLTTRLKWKLREHQPPAA